MLKINIGSIFVVMKLISLILLITLTFYLGLKPKLYYERGYWVLAYGRGKNRKYKQINF